MAVQWACPVAWAVAGSVWVALCVGDSIVVGLDEGFHVAHAAVADLNVIPVE